MIEIHEAKEADAAGLLAIYAPYVEHTAITFEYEVPTLEEFTDRRIGILGMRHCRIRRGRQSGCCQISWITTAGIHFSRRRKLTWK